MEEIGLCLPGGGARGARQAGSIEALTTYGYIPKIISCTSVGTLNLAAFLSGGIELLKKIWLEEIISTRDVYKPWLLGNIHKSLGYAQGIVFKKGWVNTKPILRLIDKYVEIDKIFSSNISAYLTSVNMNTGKLEVYNNKTSSAENFFNQIYGSAANPVFFPPLTRDNTEWWDGGLRQQVPLRELKKNLPDHIKKVFIIHTQNGELEYIDKFSNNFERLDRALEITINENWAEDSDIYFGNDIKVFHIFPKPQMVTSSMEFPGQEMKAGYAEGYSTTKKVLMNI